MLEAIALQSYDVVLMYIQRGKIFTKLSNKKFAEPFIDLDFFFSGSCIRANCSLPLL